MKEIIYYDEQTVFSILSQYGEGIIKSFQIEESGIESEAVHSSEDGSIDSGLKLNLKLSSGALPGGEINLGGNFGGKAGVNLGSSQTVSEGQRELIEKIFHDHALDILLEKLNDKYDLANTKDFKEGQFLLKTEKYRYYDFELLNRITNLDYMERILRGSGPIIPEREQKNIMGVYQKIINNQQLSKQEERSKEDYIEKGKNILNKEKIIASYTMVNDLSAFSNNILSGISLLTTENFSVICKKENLRIISEALSFRATSSQRKVTILGRVIGEKTSEASSNAFDNFKTQDLNTIPSLFLDIILESLGISKIGEKIIHPIAIYFEED